MNAALRRLVWARGKDRCEYCLIPAAASVISFCIDHIVARKHDGRTAAENLALSCFHCNSFKLDNIASLDSETRTLAKLFDPRTDVWNEHFVWRHAELIGLTPTGRVTVRILNMNSRYRLHLREAILSNGHIFT